MNDPRGPLWFDAFAVAMLAKAGTLDQHRVDAMRVKAEELLHHADPMFRAICEFATQYDLHLHQGDAGRLRELGGALHDAIELALVPVPPGQDRADIHG